MTGLVHADFSAVNSLSIVVRISLYLSMKERCQLHGRLVSCFLETNKNQGILFALAVSVVTYFLLSSFYFKILNMAKGHILGQTAIVSCTNSVSKLAKHHR